MTDTRAVVDVSAASRARARLRTRAAPLQWPHAPRIGRPSVATVNSVPAEATLVAIPALNEAGTIESVVRGVRAAVPDATILVVDDGSTDTTAAAAAAAGATVLRLPFNIGVGGAMRTAFRYAEEIGYERVVQVDADGQHDPTEIPLLLSALTSASVVIGTRFAGRGDYRVHGPRRWAMVLLARTLSRAISTPLSDVTSGFRAVDRRALQIFAEHYPAEYLGDTVESLVIAARSGLTIRQVPVAMRPRQGGRPSHRSGMASLHLGRAALALFVTFTRRREPVP